MGLTLALFLTLLIPLIVGIVSVLIGMIILIVRYIKKQKTQEEYSGSKVIGIVFLIFGILSAMAPIVLVIIAELHV